jgi:hypothetical protein
VPDPRSLSALVDLTASSGSYVLGNGKWQLIRESAIDAFSSSMRCSGDARVGVKQGLGISFVERMSYFGEKVRHLHFMSSGAFFTRPACATGQTAQWAIDANTAAGKAQLAGGSCDGKKASVFGTTPYNILADIESIRCLLVP